MRMESIHVTSIRGLDKNVQHDDIHEQTYWYSTCVWINSSRIQVFIETCCKISSLKVGVLPLVNTYAWLQASAAKQIISSLFWEITQLMVAIHYRRFRKTYRYQFPCPETSVRKYRHTLRNLTDDHRSQANSCCNFCIYHQRQQFNLFNNATCCGLYDHLQA